MQLCTSFLLFRIAYRKPLIFFQIPTKLYELSDEHLNLQFLAHQQRLRFNIKLNQNKNRLVSY